MAITAISVLRRDPALANASGLIAGATGRDGEKGGPGGPGVQGPTGRGVRSLSVDGNNNLIVTYSDGQTSNAGTVSVPPPTGADGGTF
jgi:hypothetical protein